ncbi:MAG: methylmalonyl Co-A mutase-associated GTPase MeaB [Bacteroidota bacterium]|nr:methylmalonyl Co-A mutase-associated GTPase MeaB [Bacteroidota bacterium]MCY3629899.1 methylmalonyl Co-A mutase-associated GTPase MeaB [Bacteroidota bacterium]MDE2645862.1 methylmalonyl Co-A mutase-associated GTPase MeaB [Bacteroidota bacterium]
MLRNPEIESLAEGILAGDRMSLSQGITLLESTLEADQETSERLLSSLLPKTDTALRVAVTGAPGVGKSTFIEALGMHLVESGNKVAVLTIDPSSPRTGGSILGDKTRMPRLAKHPDSFIRPSPSGTVTGGLAHATRSTILLCNAAGYNPILVETVGTGQGEYTARQTVDVVLLLVLAHAGDELQGIKRGILETADLIAVSKADGPLKERASLTAKTYRRALALSPSRSVIPKVMISSALENTGIADIWDAIKEFEHTARKNGQLDQRRHEQIKFAIFEAAKELFLTRFSRSEDLQHELQQLQKQVIQGECTVNKAAHILLRDL